MEFEFDKFMKDARNKKGEEKLDVLRKATKVHKELPPEDKGWWKTMPC